MNRLLYLPLLILCILHLLISINQVCDLSPNTVSLWYRSAVSSTRSNSPFSDYVRHYRNGTKSDAQESVEKVILLIVNFHFTNYTAMDYLDDVYLPTFAVNFTEDFDAVFIGPIQDTHFRVLANDLPIRGY